MSMRISGAQGGSFEWRGSLQGTTANSMAGSTFSASSVSERAGAGLTLMAGARDAGERRHIGDETLQQLASDATATPDQRAIIGIAMRALHQDLRGETALAAMEVTLGALAEGLRGPLAQVIARIGQEALNRAGEDGRDDVRALGSAFLDGFGKYCEDPAQKAAIESAQAAVSLPISTRSAVRLERKALQQVAQMTHSDSAEIALARLGLAARRAACYTRDAQAMTGAVMGRLQGSEDARVKELADFSVKVSAWGLGTSLDGQMRDGVFQAIAGAPGARAFDPADVSPSLAEAREVERELLLPIVEHFTSRQTDLERHRGRVRAAENALHATEARLASEKKTARRKGIAEKIGLAGLAGGIVTLAATGALLALPVAIASTAVFVFGFGVADKARQAQKPTKEQMQMLKEEREQAAGMVLSLEKELGIQRSAFEKVRACLHALQLDEIAGAVRPAPRCADPVKVEEDVVCVGGVSLPRRGRGRIAGGKAA